LTSLSSKFGETTQHVKASTTKAVAELEQSQNELRRQATNLPEMSRQGATAMRKVLNEQLAAIGSLNEIAGRHAHATQISKPADSRASMGQPPELPEYARSPAAEPPRGNDYGSPQQFRDFAAPQGNYQPAGGDQNWDNSDNGVNSLTAGLSQRFEAKPAGWGGQGGEQPAPAPAQEGGRAQWSVGDLLARASEDDFNSPAQAFNAPNGYQPQEQQRQVPAEQAWAPPAQVDLGMEEMAAAIEPQRVLDIWTRYNRGDRNAINRGIYNLHGQQTFDKVRRRYETDNTFRHIADRYVADFENLLKDAARSDPKGHAIQDNLVSDTGRIYLLLAHAAGRLN
jgi:hypothetical protein